MPLVIDFSPSDQEAIGSAQISLLTDTYTNYLALTSLLRVDGGLVDRATIRALNEAHRQHPEETDVLSFPLFTSLEELRQTALNEETLLGSIVICPDFAADQHTPLIELLHHGLLHLLGYDHETDLSAWNGAERAIIDCAHQHHLSLSGMTVLTHDTL